jgi:hypothetical protein
MHLSVTGCCHATGASRYFPQARAKSPSVGSRPCGVYLSTASGSSRHSLESNSSFARPVCFDKVSNTSGPIACFSWDGEQGLLGPVLTQDSAVSPWPVCLNRSMSSPSPHSGSRRHWSRRDCCAIGRARPQVHLALQLPACLGQVPPVFRRSCLGSGSPLCEHPEKRGHRWKSSAHSVAPYSAADFV